MARGISSLPGREASPSQVTPLQFVRFPQQFAKTHLYSWMERGTVRGNCLAQEHITVPPAWTQTTHSEDERTNHEVTAPPMHQRKMHLITLKLWRITIISIKVLNVIMATLFSNLETLYKAPYGLLKHLFRGSLITPEKCYYWGNIHKKTDAISMVKFSSYRNWGCFWWLEQAKK